MARKKSKRTKSKVRQAAHNTPQTRRKFMQMAGFGTLGLLAVGGGGAAIARSYSNFQKEHDLSAIGQGVPVIVQVHDPQGPSCAALQKQTRKALKSIPDGDVLYRVANIRTVEGQRFQSQHSMPHVTLVLFDGRGNRVGDVRGVTPADQLETIFKARFDF